MIGGGVDAIYTAALEAGVITRDEHATAMRRGARDKVIRVDDFPTTSTCAPRWSMWPNPARQPE
jgi:hypothetical protein